MKVIVGAICIFFGICIGFYTVFTNIDMTPTRLLVEFWYPFYLMIIYVWLGVYLVKTYQSEEDKKK